MKLFFNKWGALNIEFVLIILYNLIKQYYLNDS